jgi:8-oxo-dGTP diphosphatase
MGSASITTETKRDRRIASTRQADRSGVTFSREILKIGVAVTHEGRLLLVRKKGGSSYILPGGKPESGEDDLQTLIREIAEELGCGLDAASVRFLGAFSDVAADMNETRVTVRLYSASLVGNPLPRSEIESLKWYCPKTDGGPLAPSLEKQIIPFLCAQRTLIPC